MPTKDQQIAEGKEVLRGCEFLLWMLECQQREGAVLLYSDVMQQPRFARMTPLPALDLPLSDIRTAGVMSSIYWNAKGETLSTEERNRALCVLTGWAMDRPMITGSNRELADLLRNDPLLHVLYEFVKKQNQRQLIYRPSELWEKLRDIASSKSWSWEFPGGANVLTKFLNARQEQLAVLGIAFQSKGKGAVRQVEITVKDDSEALPYMESSGDKSLCQKDLSLDDAEYARMKELEKRCQSST